MRSLRSYDFRSIAKNLNLREEFWAWLFLFPVLIITLVVDALWQKAFARRTAAARPHDGPDLPT